MAVKKMSTVYSSVTDLSLANVLSIMRQHPVPMKAKTVYCFLVYGTSANGRRRRNNSDVKKVAYKLRQLFAEGKLNMRRTKGKGTSWSIR